MDSNCVTQVYISLVGVSSSGHLAHLSLLLFLNALAGSQRLVAHRSLDGTLLRRSAQPADAVDAVALALGYVTTLRQFHAEHTELFVAYVAQYIRSVVLALPLTAGCAITCNLLFIIFIYICVCYEKECQVTATSNAHRSRLSRISARADCLFLVFTSARMHFLLQYTN